MMASELLMLGHKGSAPRMFVKRLSFRHDDGESQLDADQCTIALQRCN